MIRRQLPAYSPLPFRAAAKGVAAAFGGPDRRPELEALLQRRYGAARAILTGSGTQALQTALAWARSQGRVGAGVALPAFGCFDLATAAVGADVPVVFYDLVPGTLQPDLDGLERALAAGAGTVVVTPLYGYPVAWEPVLAAARRHGALVVEDAAQGFGLEPAPHGDMVVLSFGRGKGWTGGRGGALLVAGGEGPAAPPAGGGRGGAGLAARVAAQWALGRPALFSLPASLPWLAMGETVYHPPVEPTGIEAAAAALALATLEASQAEVERRRSLAAEIRRRFEAAPGGGVRFVEEDPSAGLAPAYLRLPVLTPAGMSGFPDEGAARRAGILPSYPRALPELEVLGGRVQGSSGPFVGARALVRGLLTAPCHSKMSAGDVRGVVAVLGAYRGERRAIIRP